MLLENAYRLMIVVDMVVNIKGGKSPSMDIGSITSAMATTLALKYDVPHLANEEIDAIRNNALNGINVDFLSRLKDLVK